MVLSSPERRLRRRTRSSDVSCAPSSPTTSVLKNQFDIRRGLDALDQIARHAGAKAAAADHHVHLAGVTGEKYRRLPRGVAAADQHDLLLRAQPRLDRRGPVPDAAAFEIGEVLDLGAPVARAARHHDRFRAQHVAIVEFQTEGAVVARTIERHHRDRESSHPHRTSVPGCRRAPSAPSRIFRSESPGNFRF